MKDRHDSLYVGIPNTYFIQWEYSVEGISGSGSVFLSILLEKQTFEIFVNMKNGRPDSFMEGGIYL